MTGGTTLDAIIAYRSNCNHIGDDHRLISLSDPRAVAVQPYWVHSDSPYPNLMHQLLDALRSEVSRDRYRATGFTPAEP